MRQIILKLTDEEFRALEELAKLERRSAAEQATQIIHEVLRGRRLINSDVNESQDEQHIFFENE